MEIKQILKEKKKPDISWAWCHTLLSPALRRWKQVGFGEFEANLLYIERPRIAGLYIETLSPKKKKTHKQTDKQKQKEFRAIFSS